MEAQPARLDGFRILLAEDEALVVIEMEEILRELGCEIVGPVSTVATALAAIGKDELDGALLDINLGGECILPAVEKLLARSVPFLLTTGYNISSDEAPVLKEAPRLIKPFSVQSLEAAMTKQFARH